jgi:hypothetical protein
VAHWLVTGQTSAASTAASPTDLAAPVPLLAPAEMPSWLDFRAALHPEHLAEGWLEWNEWEGVRGWSLGQGASLYLQLSDGTLVLRGLLPSGADAPVRVQIAVHEVGARDGVIEKSGPFELRIPAPLGSLAGRNVPLFLSCDKTTALPAAGARDIGFVLSEIGFESE